MTDTSSDRPEDQIPPIREGLNRELWKLAEDFAKDAKPICGEAFSTRQFYEFAKEAAKIAKETK